MEEQKRDREIERRNRGGEEEAGLLKTMVCHKPHSRRCIRCMLGATARHHRAETRETLLCLRVRLQRSLLCVAVSIQSHGWARDGMDANFPFFLFYTKSTYDPCINIILRLPVILLPGRWRASPELGCAEVDVLCHSSVPQSHRLPRLPRDSYRRYRRQL
jgi:hypothetical protein